MFSLSLNRHSYKIVSLIISGLNLEFGKENDFSPGPCSSYCPRRVLQKAPLESPRIVLVLVYRKNLDLPTVGAQGGIGSCRECPQVMPGRCDNVYATCTYLRAEFVCITLINKPPTMGKSGVDRSPSTSVYYLLIFAPVDLIISYARGFALKLGYS